jgi:RNA polymerase sigma factor (sigma-70 family)
MKHVVEELRRAAGGRGAGYTDARLLERFARTRDEAAFAALVQRHGPMVLGVCRRVLRNEADAEDAFQAAFLVLVRKAASLRRPGSLGSWLYGVACRTALHARADAERRRARERAAARPEAVAGEAMMDLGPLLDRELSRLPDKYRAAVVLCDLEGKAYGEAAGELGCPEGTLAARLSRGRALLARRLVRQGLALSASTVAAALAQQASASALPAPLGASVTKAAVLAAAGQAAAGAVSAPAAALAERVLRAMVLTRLQTVAAALVLLILCATGAGILAYRAAAGDQAGAHQEAGPPAPRVGGKVRAVPKSELRYGGKDFNAWRDVLLTELKPQVRAEAMKALGAFGANGYGQEAAAAIVAGMRGFAMDGRDRDDLPVFEAAIAALTRIGGEAAPPLVEELSSGKRNDRRFALSVLNALGPEGSAAFPAVARAANDRDSEVRSMALRALPRLDRDGKSVPVLAGALTDKNPAVRRLGIEGLVMLGLRARGAAPDLIRATRDADLGTRVAAVDALRTVAPKEPGVVPALTAALRDRNRDVRLVALRSLGALGPAAQAAVPAMVQSLKEAQDPAERDWAVDALGSMGRAARAAVKELRAIAAVDAQLRPTIEQALRRIEE